MKWIIAGAAAVLVTASLVGLLVTSLKKKNQRVGGRISAPAAHPVHFDHTVLMDAGAQDTPAGGICTLRYIGTGEWPQSIYVDIGEKGSFSIGRFDVVLGQAVSSYEFPANSQAVSRRHAVLFRDEEGYIIQDQNSKAGTFVNGVKLEAGVFYRLKNGCQISFGTAGADYLWEEAPSAIGAGVMRGEVNT